MGISVEQMKAVASGLGYWWDETKCDSITLFRAAGQSKQMNFIKKYPKDVGILLQDIAEWHGVDYNHNRANSQPISELKIRTHFS